MSEISERYSRRADAFAEKVGAVSDEQWSASTPCDEWSARDVVEHVVNSQSMFLGFVGREMGELPSVADDPEGAVRAATGRIRADLEDPGLAAETFEGFMGTQAFEASVDRFLSVDLVVHGWDLARATGQDEAIPDEDVTLLQSSLSQLPQEAMRSPGAFGPEVPVADDASDQDRLLAWLGRRP